MDIRQEYSRTDGGDYRLGVRDFGAIERADVEFRPLTVFVGPSNTGKSYLATLSYALHRYFATEAGPNAWGFRRFARVLDPYDKAPVEPPAELGSWVLSITANDDLPRLPGPVAEAVREETERGDRVAGALQEEIVRAFGAAGVGELVRRSASGVSEIVVVPSRSVETGLQSYRIRLEGDQIDVEGNATESADPLAAIGRSPEAQRWTHVVRREALRYQALVSDGRTDDRIRTLHLQRTVGQLAEAARHPVVGPLRRLVYYLPADRTGIMHSHKMVVAAIVQNAAKAGLRQTPDVPTLSGVLTDFLEELIRMGDSNGQERGLRKARHVASQMERSVLAGTVRVERSDSSYPEFLYRPQGWSRDLSLMRASSMVSELAPLVLYLRHVVERGDVLIIEEPESHLHPAMQVEVIGWIARIVGAGVRVIVTTHSEWVLEALSNLVLASKLSNDEQSDVGLDGPALRPEDVGVWVFGAGESGGGSTVREIDLEDVQLYSSSFDDVAAGTYNKWARIADLVERGQ